MSVTYLAKSELTALVAELVRAMPALDEVGLRLAVELYRELATGEPVSAS